MATISLAIPPAPINDDGQSSEAEVEEPSLPFHRLPDEIIEQILDYTSPNSFASLLLLNRRWREVADRSYLYARHLSNCPSYSAAHRSNTPPEGEDCLPQLRRLFAHEVKRNLFEAYLRPRETVINLVSTSISSSSAPGGEAFHFSLSSKGHYVLAYSSSRIHVIDVTAPEIVVKRELKIFRRPVATTITDNGSLLAVLSTDLQVDLYDLTGEHPKHTQVVPLDHTPRTIALSPTGSILAAAYDSGVEVSSLDPGASIERRSVKCYAVDSLSFSGDSTQLLGTTLQSRNPSTVVLTAPYYDPGSSLQEESVSALWTNSLLFPNLSRDCSHAVLLPSHLDDEASWTFTYDRVFETFRAVRIDDLRNGTTYFTGPTAEFGSVSHLLPSTLPAASASGDLVAAGFQGSIWLYGVPEDLDATPNISNGMNSNIESEVGTPVSPIGRRNSAPSLRSINRRPSTSRTPQWQLLCDKVRNTFIEGRKMASLDGVSAMTWVSDFSESHGERLVAVAPGVGSQSPVSDDDGMLPTDGGRITILDFKYGTFDGSKRVVTVEVGEKEPQVLEEEHRDMDTEVAIVRRRTVAQRGRGNRIGGGNIGRSPTSAARAVPPPLPVMPVLQDLGDPYEPQPSLSSSRRPSQQVNLSDGADTVSVDDEEEAFDAPYSQTSPRSGTTLRRAATAAAINRRLHPRAVAPEHIEYRRADGRNEHPHESDADNWVPPPPPYSKDPVPTLPEHLQRAVLAEASRNLQQSQRPPATSDPPGLAGLGSLHRTRTTFTTASAESRQRTSLQRTLSDSTTRTTRSSSIDEDVYRPVTSPVTITFDDIYDVSPPGTPQPTRRETSRIQQPIPRRPVGSGAASFPAFAPNPAMRATVQQPVSPIPPMTTDMPGRRTVSWEDSTGPTGETIGGEETSSTTSKRLTRDRMDQALPPPPNDEHHLTSPPPTTEGLLDEANNMPKLQASPPQPKRSETAPIPARAVDTGEEPLSIPKRSDTAPVLTSHSPNGPLSPSLESVGMPSADQLARLNSRTGRPPRNVLANPSQRRSSSGPHAPPQFTVGNGVQQSRRRSVSDPRQRPFAVNNSPVRSGQSQRLTPDQAFRSTPPRAAVGAHGSPARPSNGSRLAPSSSPSHGRYPPSTSPSRRGSQGSISSRQNEPPSPGLRPPMARLETIRSVSSAGEPSPFFNPKPMTLGRTQSRAEKNTPRKIKDAKKKGWRASMRKERSKPKAREAAGNMAWTGDPGEGVDVKGKDDKKCVIM